MLNHVAVLFLIYRETSIKFSIVAAPIHKSNDSAQGFLFLHIFATVVICYLFDNSQSGKCEVISHSGFDLDFPDD